MRSYHARFYLPILLLWGSMFVSTLSPALIQSDIRFEPDIEPDDLLQIDLGGDIALDDLVIYRLEWFDFVARVIGLPGDEITLGLDGNSIVRNGERVVLAPPGFEISMTETGMMTIEEGEAAVFVHDSRRNPVSAVISRDAIRGPMEKIYRYSDLGRSEWIRIGIFSAIVLALVFLPFAALIGQPSPSFFRLIVLVTHTFMTVVISAGLIVTSLPGDPLRVGVTEPVWWWFPLAVVEGFRLELLLAAVLFLAAQWLIETQPWRRHAQVNDES